MIGRLITPVMSATPSIVNITGDPAAAVRTAVTYLRKGFVIAVPTDTVYGIAASAQHVEAIKSLYDIKKRDENKPIAICLSKVADISHWGITSNLPAGLLEKLLPGPVTVVLKRTNNLNKLLNPGNTLVGIRVPDDDFIRLVCENFKEPIALTSANFSCKPSSKSVTEFQELWPHLAMIFDEGKLPGSRSGSTVIDLSETFSYKIVREGSALIKTVRTLDSFNLRISK